MPNLPPVWRRWIYIVTATAIPLLVAYEVLEDAIAPLWLALAGAVLGTGAPVLAALNVPKDGKPDDE
jgi:hypothetical protein